MTPEQCRSFVLQERAEALLAVGLVIAAGLLVHACWQRWGHRLW